MNTKTETAGNFPKYLASHHDSGPSNLKPVVFITMALWLGLVALLALRGAFVGGPDSPPLGIFLGLTIPLAVFFAAYFGWPAFRAFILGADIRHVVAMQAWRWGGLGFLSLYANGVLPATFAFPAGLGDMAIGVTAPWILLRLLREPSFGGSRQFKLWNILGIVDFVVAVSMGTLSSGFIHQIVVFNGNVTTGAMARLPLVLIPAYMVPFFIMSHATALFQARRLTQLESSRAELK